MRMHVPFVVTWSVYRLILLRSNSVMIDATSSICASRLANSTRYWYQVRTWSIDAGRNDFYCSSTFLYGVFTVLAVVVVGSS